MICKKCGSGTVMVTTMNRKVGNQHVKSSCKCMKCENQWLEIQEMPVVCTGEKPSYANKFAAGLDIRSNEGMYLYPGDIKDIEILLAAEIPVGHFGMVVARSGLSYKHQIKLINDVGIIDEDFRGNIGIRLINEGKEPYMIEKGDRIAQMIIIPYIQPKLVYVDELSETDRNTKGFGSTGK